jgi:hypothetical protein
VSTSDDPTETGIVGIGGGGSVGVVVPSSCRASLMARSNITNYAFLDEDARVRVYVDLPGVGNCRDEDVVLDYTERSMCLTIRNYPTPSSSSGGGGTSDGPVVDCSATAGGGGGGEGEVPPPTLPREDRSLSLGRLYAEIEGATFRKKSDRVVVTLKKKDKQRTWSAVLA